MIGGSYAAGEHCAQEKTRNDEQIGSQKADGITKPRQG